jgi:CHAT domain-containing protein
LLAAIYDPVYDRDDERLQAAAGHPLLLLPSGSFKRLLYSRKEAEEITKMAGTSRVLKLSGVDANREAILNGALRDYRYLHFSVHGDPNLKEADRSALVLSALGSHGTTVDPFLRARDIQGLNLSADLVVLSACGSGLGQEFPGEGIVGLPQAFLSAGASGVIVSLWEVDDLAASNFMPLLYSNLLKRGLTPAEALRQAQIGMWRQRRWNAPSYWAGFVGMGEWR